MAEGKNCSVRVSRTIKMSAEALWKRFGNYTHIAWIPMADASTAENDKGNNEIGAIRCIRIGEKKVHETLIEYYENRKDKAYHYTYDILPYGDKYPLTECPFPEPPKDYLATLSIKSKQDDTADVQWVANWSTSDKIKNEFEEVIKDLFESGIDMMEAHARGLEV